MLEFQTDYVFDPENKREDLQYDERVQFCPTLIDIEDFMISMKTVVDCIYP